MRLPCKHGVVLPRALKCDRGYLVLRLKLDGRWLPGVHCGPHTPANEKAARLKLDEMRLKQKLGTLHIPNKVKRLKFELAKDLYYTKHFEEYRDPKTNEPRSAESKQTARSHLAAINSWFSDFYIDAITVRDLVLFRQKRLEVDGVANGTINRDMSVLASMLNMFRYWVEADEIEPVKLPINKEGAAHNPCELLPDLHEEPRKRVATMDEIRRLLVSCDELKDGAMRSIILTEIYTSLRLNDLMKLENAVVNDDVIDLIQGKTRKDIQLPGDTKPNWSKVFTNFRSRWEAVRANAGIPDLQFRDLRKTSLQMLQGLFSDEDIAKKAGHSSSVITKKWYLRNTQAEETRPMFEAIKRKLQENGIV
jgi:integrase